MGASDLTSAAIYNQFLNDFLCSSHLSSNHEAKKALLRPECPCVQGPAESKAAPLIKVRQTAHWVRTRCFFRVRR
jgi:hypothetical protein